MLTLLKSGNFPKNEDMELDLYLILVCVWWGTCTCHGMHVEAGEQFEGVSFLLLLFES